MLGQHGEVGDRLLERPGEQRVQELAVRKRPPQSVGTEQQHVVARKARLLDRVGLRRLVAAEALQDAVALGMGRQRFLADAAFVEELLHHRVIARALDNAALAHEVQPAIADMRPVGVAVLNHAGDDHGARHIREALLVRLAHDRYVRTRHRAGEELRGVGERRARVALERGAEVLDRNLRRELAAQVPAEAVGHHHQKRPSGAPVTQAVLVHPPRADERLVGENAVQKNAALNLTSAPQTCCSNGTGSARCPGSFSPSSAFCSANTLCGRSR